MDQETNDLDKSLFVIKNLLEDKDFAKNGVILLFGANGGRLDQEMATFHCLHKWRRTFYRIALLNEDSISFLLEGGQKYVMELLGDIEGPTCGLIPLAGKVNSVSTKGKPQYCMK